MTDKKEPEKKPERIDVTIEVPEPMRVEIKGGK